MQSTEVEDTNVLLCEFIPLLYLCLFILNKNKYIFFVLCCALMAEMNTQTCGSHLAGRINQERKRVTLRSGEGGVGLPQRVPGILPVGPTVCSSSSMNLHSSKDSCFSY
jgi:hypothetical protein